MKPEYFVTIGMTTEEITALNLTPHQLVKEMAHLNDQDNDLRHAPDLHIGDTDQWRIDIFHTIQNIALVVVVAAGWKERIDTAWNGKWMNWMHAMGINHPYLQAKSSLELITMFEAGYTIDDLQLMGWHDMYQH